MYLLFSQLSRGAGREETGEVSRMTFMTRRERRARRRRGFVTARQAQLAARLACLDYKVSGETGAMRVPSRMRMWYYAIARTLTRRHQAGHGTTRAPSTGLRPADQADIQRYPTTMSIGG